MEKLKERLIYILMFLFFGILFFYVNWHVELLPAVKKFTLLIKYIWEFENVFKFLLVYEILEVVFILISFIYFLLFYSNHSINSQFKIYVQKLSSLHKFFFIWFTLFYAIPNKIWINNEVSSFSVSLFTFLVIVLSSVFPSFLLLYILFWVSVLESYFFAVLYENKATFKKFINNLLFKNNTRFAKEYFAFFWGNMNSGGAGKSKAGVVGTLLGGLYKLGRNQEQNHVREQTSKEMNRHLENAQQKPKTPEESLAFQKQVEDHIIDRDTTILKGEKQLKHLSDTVVDWWNNG